MSIIKVSNGQYLNPDALERTIPDYIYRGALFIGGLAVDPCHAVENMRMTKELWNQTEGKQLHHFVLRFSDWESSRIDNITKLIALAYRICEYYATEYQIVFGIHDYGTYHIHFVLNSVNYRTGAKFIHRNSDDHMLAEYIREFMIPTTLGHTFAKNRIRVFYY